MEFQMDLNLTKNKTPEVGEVFSWKSEKNNYSYLRIDNGDSLAWLRYQNLSEENVFVAVNLTNGRLSWWTIGEVDFIILQPKDPIVFVRKD